MDLKSPNLNMPYIAPAQAQKHVTHNEALSRLDAIVQLSVLAVTDTPPENPQEGQRVIIGAAPSGDFEGQALKLAAFQDGVWMFYEAKMGWRAYVEDVLELRIFNGTDWTPFTSGSSEGVEIFGINTAADSFNRLAVKGPATLLDNEGAGHQLKINKAAEADTASLLFQSGYSGHAEMGLTGSQDFHIKTSADGGQFKDSLIANAKSGGVDFPHGINSAQRVVPMDICGGPDEYYGFPNSTSITYLRNAYSFVASRVIFSAIYVDRQSVLTGGFVAQYTASTTTGSVIRAGVYKMGVPNGAGWEVGARVVDFGAQPADVAGQKHFTLATPVTLEAGWYLSAVGVNGDSARARALRNYQPQLNYIAPHNTSTTADFRFVGPSHYMFSSNANEIANGFPETWPTNPVSDVLTTVNYSILPFIPKWRF